MSEIEEKQNCWERFRPDTINDVVLPDRIKKIAEKGIYGNYLFYSTPGNGKTTLARILVQGRPVLSLNSKLGVDVLRNKVYKFCRESIPFEDPNKLRVVYFEEFDRASTQLQEELKSFMEDEKFSNRVRFLATCNNISKIIPEIKSRFILIDFRPTLQELKENHVNRICDISKNNNIDITKEQIESFVNKRFPDVRKIWQDIQEFSISGVQNTKSNNINSVDRLFKLITVSKYHDPIKTWDFLFSEWSENIHMAFEVLGREFFYYVKDKLPEKKSALPNIVTLLSDYSDLRLSNASDPFITLYSLVVNYQKYFK
jgi:DNA polymerase III delta prime subunit